MDDLDEPQSGQDAAAEPEGGKPARRRIALDLPEGWPGVLLLLVVAALSGGLIAAYWPTFFGGGDVGTSQERIAALETRVGQIAAGRAGAAASGIFDDLRHEIVALVQRLDADEARLTGLEKSSEQTGGPGGAELAPMRQKLDAATAGLSDLAARMAKLESAPHGSSAELSAIGAKATALDGRLGTLEADLSRSMQTLNGSVAALETRLKALEANAPPADLAQRLEAFATKSEEAGIEERLKLLEAQNSGESLHRAATMLALAGLARAVGEPGPFALELDTFAVAAPGDAAIAALQPYAAIGVPTHVALAARFPAIARDALDAELSSNAQGFWARLWANIRSLISVRRVGEVSGADTESWLARAQVRLDANDLAAATGEVRALKGPAAKTMAPWLKDAEARLALDRALAQMNARIVQSLAAAAQLPASAPPANVAPPPALAPTPAQGGTP